MKKETKLILMFCLVLSASLCYAHDAAKTEKKKDNVPIQLIESSSLSSSDKSGAIIATINGHMMTISFTENLGQVAVEVTTALGGNVECLSITTPNGLQIYIPNTGDYIVTFTLPNGDEYYGEFTVTD
jgi:hypothetical protein